MLSRAKNVELWPSHGYNFLDLLGAKFQCYDLVSEVCYMGKAVVLHNSDNFVDSL